MSSLPLHDVVVQLRALFSAGKRCPKHFRIDYDDGGPPVELDFDLFPEPKNTEATTHTEDFSSVVWFGTSYTFTTAQRPIVERLWATWEADMPGVTGEAILEAAGSEARRLRDVFKDSPAWGTMIQSIRRGVYALVEPPVRG